MKEKILIVGILILSISTYSQSSKVKFGLKGGMNLFNYKIEQPEPYLETIEESKFNVGFFTSIFLNYNFNKKFNIQIEPTFSKKQTQLSTFFGDRISIDDKISEYSIETPLVIRYSINEKFEIEGGFNIAYIIKEKWEKNIEIGIYSENHQLTEDINEFETGLIIGGLYNITTDIGFNLRYNYSFNEQSGVLLNKRVISIGIEYKI